MRDPSRRHFLGATLGMLALPWFPTGHRCHHGASRSAGPHPTPRPGVTAERVPAKAQLPDNAETLSVFEQVREIPEVLDGIRCKCGCAEYKDYYSLLSCFEAPDVMAKDCLVCQAQGRLVARMHKAGRSLDEIRKGIDARFP